MYKMRLQVYCVGDRMSDLYTEFTENLTPLPGEDNIKKERR